MSSTETGYLYAKRHSLQTIQRKDTHQVICYNCLRYLIIVYYQHRLLYISLFQSIITICFISVLRYCVSCFTKGDMWWRETRRVAFVENKDGNKRRGSTSGRRTIYIVFCVLPSIITLCTCSTYPRYFSMLTDMVQPRH